MQDSNHSEISRPLSIGKKKGGFLFASAPEKTPEDLRREEEERRRQEREELERQYSAPAAPSNIPLATFGIDNDENDDEMATASSLRERLKQYQSLKAEQEMTSARNNNPQTDPDSFMGPPINNPEETKQEAAKDDETPGKWISYDFHPDFMMDMCISFSIVSFLPKFRRIMGPQIRRSGRWDNCGRGSGVSRRAIRRGRSS
jgi:hypothetical protein